jgi:hypothetical protein
MENHEVTELLVKILVKWEEGIKMFWTAFFLYCMRSFTAWRRDLLGNRQRLFEEHGTSGDAIGECKPIHQLKQRRCGDCSTLPVRKWTRCWGGSAMPAPELPGERGPCAGRHW